MVPKTNFAETFSPLRALSVEGFKSIDQEQTLEVRPLTILAGTNSSGKSSMIQPLLLLKQTLEAPYDPGPLLLNGANAKFTLADQFMNHSRVKRKEDRFAFGLSLEDKSSCKITFVRPKRNPVELDSLRVTRPGEEQLYSLGITDFDEIGLSREELTFFDKSASVKVTTTRNRCFVDVSLAGIDQRKKHVRLIVDPRIDSFERSITHLIHVPGHRGNPRRNYPLTAVGERYPGTFDEYVASVIAAKKEDSAGSIEEMSSDLLDLGLTWKVEAKAVDHTQVEIRVGRLPQPKQGGARDLVSIADVGFGVSQTLPVVVALRIALPGQTVYIEQPEIHLHPKAQHAMAKLLASAAQRGVRVIAETHSLLILLGVQRLIAEGKIDPALVKLHWFSRDEKGLTRISSHDLDSAGRFGDWPVDFDDVSLEAQMAYLKAAEQRVANDE